MDFEYQELLNSLHASLELKNLCFLKVLNLLNNEPLEEWDFNQQEPLPQNSEEWWTFYRNIMNRLDARNAQIANVLKQSNKKED